MFRIISFLIIVIALLPDLVLDGPVPPARETKRVMVLYSLDKGHPAHGLTEQGIREVFQNSSRYDVQLYTEYLDMGRFPAPAQIMALAGFLRSKYADSKIDAIIAVYPSAVDFLLKEQGILFPGVPIVAAEVTRAYADNLERSPARRRIAGTIMGDNISGVLDAALRMKPDTKRVALVSGISPLDIYNEQIFREGIKRYSHRLELIDLSRLPMAEILARVSSLPPDTIILYPSIIRDGAGRGFTPREALSLITRAANAPVFSLYDTFLGQGIVGGHLVSFDLQGKTAGAQVLRIFAGESPAGIPFGGDNDYVDHYDWRELRKWNIPENAVPPGAALLYRQPSVWEEHRSGILVAIAIIGSESALIVGLLVNLRRRRKAEQLLTESEMRLKLAANAAGAGMWSLDVASGRIWATERAIELYGFVPGVVVNFDKFLTRVHPEDRDKVVRLIDEAVRDKHEHHSEYRIMLPDGSIRWMSVRGSYIPSPEGLDGLTGVTIDITDRKQTEDVLKQGARELSSLMGRLISAQETERSHIARELHDDFTQRLAALAIEMGALELQRDPDQLLYSEKLPAIKKILVKLSKDIHSLSRQLHPSILDDLGLVRALESEMERFTEKEGIRVLFNHEDLPAEIPRDIGLSLYRVTQEGLRNIARHSGVTTAHVELQGLPDAIHLTIADTGCGFDPNSGRERPGLGLSSMKERIELVHGSLTIESKAGEGTFINARVPFGGELS
jgi:PAS domain S-box-containing protein